MMAYDTLVLYDPPKKLEIIVLLRRRITKKPSLYFKGWFSNFNPAPSEKGAELCLRTQDQAAFLASVSISFFSSSILAIRATASFLFLRRSTSKSVSIIVLWDSTFPKAL